MGMYGMRPSEQVKSQDQAHLLAALTTIIKAYEGAAADIPLWREAKAAVEGAAPPERLRSLLVDLARCYNGAISDQPYWQEVRNAIFRNWLE